jgi:hypothetical protein
LGGYYPDIETSKEYIEVEMFQRLDHLTRKSNRWGNKKKKVLIIGINDEIRRLFDDIILWDC